MARAERQILAFMLQGVEFCSAVERSGALGRFFSMDRRQFAESLLTKSDLARDPESAVAALDDEKERSALLHELWEIQRGGVVLSTVEKALLKYCQKADERITKESAARRKAARAARV